LRPNCGAPNCGTQVIYIAAGFPVYPSKRKKTKYKAKRRPKYKTKTEGKAKGKAKEKAEEKTEGRAK